MKVKQDFVTNSSSTAFIINWRKYEKDPYTVFTKEEAQAYLESYGKEWDKASHIVETISRYTNAAIVRGDSVEVRQCQDQLYSHILHYVKETSSKWVVWVLRDESLSTMDRKVFPPNYDEKSSCEPCWNDFPHL